MRRSIGIVAVTGLFLGACGDNADPESPTAERSVGDELVTFEAHWQCERQRHAFDQLEDLTARFEATREAAGITGEAYADFQERLADDVDLRLEVLAAYQAECG